MATWQEVEKLLVHFQMEKNENGAWIGGYQLNDRSQIFSVYKISDLKDQIEQLDFDLLYIASPFIEARLVAESTDRFIKLVASVKPPFGIVNTPINVLEVATTIPLKSISINDLEPILEKSIRAICIRADLYENFITGEDNW